jgi:L-ascorbate metabolism protein UlaG (beta-lactamase superfamily)
MNRRSFFKRSTLLALGGALAATGAFALSPARNRYYSGPPSHNFDGTRFFNPGGAAPKGFADVLKWQTGGGRTAWPEAIAITPTKPADKVDDMTITMVGHATLLVQVAGLNLLTDPVWSLRASPFSFAGPKRATVPGIRFEHLPRIDAVLLTHNHYDHLDLETLARLKAAHDPLVITPLGNDAIIRDAVPDMRVQTGNWGNTARIGPTTVHFEPCHHWSARGARDRSMALWSAFVIDTPAGRIHHIGDTGFDQGRPYRHIPEKHGKIRAAVLPVGAYEPRWFMRDQHQDPAEAVEGFILSGAAHAVGHHWGTFQLTNEGRDAPPRELAAALAKRGLSTDRFRPLAPGEAWAIPKL